MCGVVRRTYVARLAATRRIHVTRRYRLHEAGVRIFSAMYGRDFAAENDLLNALDLDVMSLDELKTLCQNGFAPSAA